MSDIITPSRRAFVTGTALLASLGMPWVHAQGKLEKTRVQLSVGGKAAFCYLPLTIASQLGYFKAEGIDLEITDSPAGSPILDALTSGAVEVCSGAFEDTIKLQARGKMFRAFVLQGRAPQIAFGISTRVMPLYKSIADLKGKSIGVSAPGSSSTMIARIILSRGGVKPGEVNFVGVGTATEALAAWRSGELDAISNAEPVMTMLEQKGDVKIISDTRTMKGTAEVFGGVMPAACLYAPEAFILKNPGTIQGLTNAIVRGLKWLQTAGPADIIKTIPESYFLGDRALYLASFNKVRESIALDGIIPSDGVKNALRALSSFGPSINGEKIAISKTYTNEFSLRAKERFKA